MLQVKATLTIMRMSKPIGKITWHNAWGGMLGSLANYGMRKTPAPAWTEIADGTERGRGTA